MQSTMVQNTAMNPRPTSYARIAEQEQYPTKEQAIVLDAIEGLSVQEYAIAIGRLIEPRNLRFISRISHGRICLYLSSKEIADRLTDSNTKVNIGTHTLGIRPLISKAKRIIMSNVCPIIPRIHIEEELAKINIKPTSNITTIKAGINESGFAHVQSFRRQMYILPEDIEKLPDSLQINYDSTSYWIYFSTEKLTCFLCKEEGHLARHCKTTDTNTQYTQNVNMTANNAENSTATLDSPVSTITVSKEGENIMPPPTSTKRQLSTSGSSTTTTTNKPDVLSQRDKDGHKTKIHKSTQPISENDVAIQLQSAKEYIINNESSFPLTYENLLKFLKDSYDNANTKESALKYTDDLTALDHMLADIYPHLSERSLKGRFTRIKKRLHSANPDLDTSSDDGR